MEEHFSLGRSGGTLLVREEGPRVIFEGQLPEDGQGLYKVYLIGRGAELLLGTLMPERGKLYLHRTLTVAELERQGCWPVKSAEARLAFSFAPHEMTGWRREENPARLMGDEILAHAVGEVRGLLFRTDEDGFSLAAPLEGGRAFPMTPIFCFAHPETLSMRPYAIFQFNHRGFPIFQNKENEAGHTREANQKRS